MVLLAASWRGRWHRWMLAVSVVSVVVVVCSEAVNPEESRGSRSVSNAAQGAQDDMMAMESAKASPVVIRRRQGKRLLTAVAHRSLAAKVAGSRSKRMRKRHRQPVEFRRRHRDNIMTETSFTDAKVVQPPALAVEAREKMDKEELKLQDGGAKTDSRSNQRALQSSRRRGEPLRLPKPLGPVPPPPPPRRNGPKRKIQKPPPKRSRPKLPPPPLPFEGPSGSAKVNAKKSHNMPGKMAPKPKDHIHVKTRKPQGSLKKNPPPPPPPLPPLPPPPVNRKQVFAMPSTVGGSMRFLSHMANSLVKMNPRRPRPPRPPQRRPAIIPYNGGGAKRPPRRTPPRPAQPVKNKQKPKVPASLSSYGAPQAPVDDGYSAPQAPVEDDYSAPQASVVVQDSYGAPKAPPAKSSGPSKSPTAPSIGFVPTGSRNNFGETITDVVQPSDVTLAFDRLQDTFGKGEGDKKVPVERDVKNAAGRENLNNNGRFRPAIFAPKTKPVNSSPGSAKRPSFANLFPKKPLSSTSDKFKDSPKVEEEKPMAPVIKEILNRNIEESEGT